MYYFLSCKFWLKKRKYSKTPTNVINHLLYVIIRLMSSLLVWPKGITLSGFYVKMMHISISFQKWQYVVNIWAKYDLSRKVSIEVRWDRYIVISLDIHVYRHWSNCGLKMSTKDWTFKQIHCFFGVDFDHIWSEQHLNILVGGLII